MAHRLLKNQGVVCNFMERLKFAAIHDHRWPELKDEPGWFGHMMIQIPRWLC